MQQLPYVVVTNPHVNEVYDLYYNAFDTFRKVKDIKTLEDNDRFCKTIRSMLKAHLTVIPKLAMGILESNGLMDAAELDKFMNTILRSVSSRYSTLHRFQLRLTNSWPPAHLPSSHRRATPRANRHLPRALVLPRRQTLRVGVYRRNLSQMLRQRRRLPVRQRRLRDPPARLRA